MGFGAASTGQRSYRSGRQQGEPSGPCAPATRWAQQFRTRRSAALYRERRRSLGQIERRRALWWSNGPRAGVRGPDPRVHQRYARPPRRWAAKRRQPNRFRPMALKSWRPPPRARYGSPARPAGELRVAGGVGHFGQGRGRSAGGGFRLELVAHQGERVVNRDAKQDSGRRTWSPTASTRLRAHARGS